MRDTHKLAALISQMIPLEIQKIANLDFHHMGDLGSAYEGLSEEISKIISSDISNEIRVVSGQITVNGVVVPAQIDRMLVHGDGIEMGINSRKYQYDIKQVLVIIESKKTLSKKELNFTLSHFLKISSAYGLRPRTTKPSGKKKSLAYDLAKMSCDKKTLRDNYKSIIDIFLSDYDRPLFVCVSYSGYKSISALCESYENSLFEHVSKGAGFWDLPNIILCGDMCVIRDGFSSTIHRSENMPGLGIQGAKVNGIDFLVLAIWKKLIRSGLANDIYDFDFSLFTKAKPFCWFPCTTLESHSPEPFSELIDMMDGSGEKFFETPIVEPTLVNESFRRFFIKSMNYGGPTKGRMRYALDEFKRQDGIEAYKDALAASQYVPHLFHEKFLMFGVGSGRGFYFLRCDLGLVYFAYSMDTITHYCIENKVSGRVDVLKGIVVDSGSSEPRTAFAFAEGWIEKNGDFRTFRVNGKNMALQCSGQSFKSSFSEKILAESV